MNYEILKIALSFFTNDFHTNRKEFEASSSKDLYIVDVLDRAIICEAYEDWDIPILLDEVLSLIRLLEEVKSEYISE